MIFEFCLLAMRYRGEWISKIVILETKKINISKNIFLHNRVLSYYHFAFGIKGIASHSSEKSCPRSQSLSLQNGFLNFSYFAHEYVYWVAVSTKTLIVYGRIIWGRAIPFSTGHMQFTTTEAIRVRHRCEVKIWFFWQRGCCWRIMILWLS